MSRVFEIDPAEPDSVGRALEAAAEAVGRGGLVVLPTETVYGIACRPDDPLATARVFEAKRRPSGLNLPVLASDEDAAWELGEQDPRAVNLGRAFWPGPLTIVVPRSTRSGGWRLGDAQDTIALRVPDFPLASSLLRAAGPLATTSANLSGHPPIHDREGLVGTFGEQVDVYLALAPGVDSPGEAPSTIVDLTGPGLRLLRAGPISLDRIEAAASPA